MTRLQRVPCKAGRADPIRTHECPAANTIKIEHESGLLRNSIPDLKADSHPLPEDARGILVELEPSGFPVISRSDRPGWLPACAGIPRTPVIPLPTRSAPHRHAAWQVTRARESFLVLSRGQRTPMVEFGNQSEHSSNTVAAVAEANRAGVRRVGSGFGALFTVDSLPAQQTAWIPTMSLWPSLPAPGP